MPSAAVTAKGQITLPQAVRDRLGVNQGDRVAFRERPDGALIIEAASVDLLDLAGAVRPRRRGVSLRDMADAVRRARARR